MDKKKERKTKKVQIRFTESDYAAIEKKANEDNRTVSDHIRNLTLTDLNNN